MSLVIANKAFKSRLFLGTGKFPSTKDMIKAVQASGTELVTVALKRVNWDQGQEEIIHPLQQNKLKLLPNTSGAKTAEEAIFLAELGRELFATPWVKLEIHPDHKYLMPDPIETLEAAKVLVEKGFIVLPYVHADPVLCKRLEHIGCAAVMPLAAPIGSNQGLNTKAFLEIIIHQSAIPVVIDAGLGAPSHAAHAMELGADAVLVNTAIASASASLDMAKAFSQAVVAGRLAFESGLGPVSDEASATSPLTSFLEECI